MLAGSFGDRRMVSAAEHDEYWLSVSLEDLAAVVTPEQVIKLSRCGIRCDVDDDLLAVFT